MGRGAALDVARCAARASGTRAGEGEQRGVGAHGGRMRGQYRKEMLLSFFGEIVKS